VSVEKATPLINLLECVSEIVKEGKWWGGIEKTVKKL
jgi:hypothetical protein